MKLTQFQSMVRIEYTEGEEATAVVRLPVLAASDVLLTAGLNVYWASPVLALPEPLKYIYKGMSAKADPKPIEQPTNPAPNPAGEQPDPKAAVTIEDGSGRRTRSNVGWTGIAHTLFEHTAAERKKQGLPTLTEETIERVVVNLMGVVEVDLVAFLKSLGFPSGTYCLRRATPMDKLLVQPAPNRVLKQEHLNLLYHQLLYLQQELCEVKFIHADVVRDGTYNGGIVEDKQVVPDTDPEKPGTSSEEPKPKPKPEPDVDTETQAVPTAEHLQTQGYTIAYIHNGVPIIFGKAPFKTNKRNQQIDSNGYLTISNVDTQLRVTNQGTKFVSYEAAVGKKPLAAELDAAGYAKDKAGKYYAVLPRQQTTVLPSNSPNGRFEEVSKDANGYSISYAAEAETGVYKWFVNLGTAEAKPKEDPPVPKPPKEESSPEPSAPEPARPEPEPEYREEPAPVEPSPARPEPEPAPEHHDPEPAPESSVPAAADQGVNVVPVHASTYLPRYRARSASDNMTAYGYQRDKFGNYPAIAPITKYVAAEDTPEYLKEGLPTYTDSKNSILKWVTQEDPETMQGESYWAVDYREESM